MDGPHTSDLFTLNYDSGADNSSAVRREELYDRPRYYGYGPSLVNYGSIPQVGVCLFVHKWNSKLPLAETGLGIDHDLIWCYAQTWEHVTEADSITNEIGDGDPLDSCDIGEAVAGMGLVYRVKVLGALPLMDSAETDWKV